MLKPSVAGLLRGTTACTNSRVLNTTRFSFVTDVLVVSRSQAGTTYLSTSSLTCPSGYNRLSRNLNDGAPPFNGAVTTAALCVRLASDRAAFTPLVAIRTAASPDDCAANGDGAAGIAPGTRRLAVNVVLPAGNLAVGTAAAPVYLCLRRLAAARG